MDLSTEQRKNLDFFYSILPEMLEDKLKKGKFVVIHQNQVWGIFDTFATALEAAVPVLPRREFVIQRVVSEDDYKSFVIASTG